MGRRSETKTVIGPSVLIVTTMEAILKQLYGHSNDDTKAYNTRPWDSRERCLRVLL